jgi:hypothetical protein
MQTVKCSSGNTLIGVYSLPHAHVRMYIHSTYICMYVYTYICTYDVHNMYMRTYTHTHTHTNSHTYIHTCIHTYIHAYIHIYIHIDMYVLRKHIHTYIRTYTHTHIPRPYNLWLHQTEGREGQTKGCGKQEGELANQQRNLNTKIL